MANRYLNLKGVKMNEIVKQRFKHTICNAIDWGNTNEIYRIALSIVETAVRESATKIDDIFVLPIIEILRNRLEAEK